TCVASVPPTHACTPFKCASGGAGCLTTCASDGDCVAGYGCAGGACKAANGQACGTDAECKSGFCTDGVCCEARCHGTCEKCSLAGRPGFCDPIPDGQDPDDE